ncbi:MAG TPA: YfiR family protein [Rhizomicrobium sp.]|jgi:uncharacterized Zn-binding protein involved in type VI secretion
MAILTGIRRLAAAAAAIGTVAMAPDAPASATIEYSVKAAYLAKFGIFVEWPKTAFGSPQSPVVLCIEGADPFGDTLDKLVAGQRVGARPIVVRRVKVIARDSGCAILFAGGSDAQSVDEALAAVNGTGVLTVADTGHDGRSAIVEFVVQEGRVRFTIDGQAAAQNGIVVSSHLLSLALSVKPKV